MQTSILRTKPRTTVFLINQFRCLPSPTASDNGCSFYTQQQQQQLNKSQQQVNVVGMEIPVQTQKLLKLSRTVVPRLTDSRHKGQYGRIGVVGGSLEYTGAPYFAAISSLKIGADLAHVFCQKEAAIVIKSYSPELIVHPNLDDENAVEIIAPWLERLHVIIIGPGLGRDPEIQKTVIELIKVCLQIEKPMVIDADGLAILNDHLDLIQGQRNVILTPNAMEFRRLFGTVASPASESDKFCKERMASLGEGVIVLEKGAHDRIHIPNTSEIYVMPSGGSGRRCGGQGDLLCGALSVFFHWSLEANQANPGFLAAFAASYFLKHCNAAAFQKHGRGMLATDMIGEIPSVFARIFESNEGTQC
ncbi:ATP-dependent (S)-NAD(P)H-hydrate dehydratase [Stomoxys calcitrans]|uniref:ATP-dependent (S)-NAD(P)H-hydrate dehydratase n=1 Tax=Stomoxys calcitrans TaxID=35570 RepID=A0A1I8QBS2_STOCA|nr:ATP-dependent (S)-NAD(P)H-hydrate dehydratase [Stomoxys calcitrans]